jgi:hypothetical protein
MMRICALNSALEALRERTMIETPILVLLVVLAIAAIVWWLYAANVAKLPEQMHFGRENIRAAANAAHQCCALIAQVTACSFFSTG